MTASPPQRLHQLDALRGVAALAVVLSHVIVLPLLADSPAAARVTNVLDMTPLY